MQSLALIVVSPLAWLTITLLPYEVTALASDFGLGSSAAGGVVAGELLALALTAIVINKFIVSLDKRRLTLVGIVVALAASIGSLITEATGLLVALRLVFGVGSGLIAAATNALPVLSRSPERTIAWMQIAVAINFGAAIFGTSALAPHAGGDAPFLIELGLLCALGVFAMFLSRGTGAAETGAAATRARLPPGAPRVLVATGLMFLSQAAVWAYAEQAGTSVGYTAAQLGTLLTLAAFTTPLGGFAAVALASRLGYAIPLIIGFGVQIFVALATYVFASRAAYASAIMVFNMTTPFTTAYLLSMLAELDRSGRGTSLSGSAVNLGAAAGPALAAVVVIMPSRAPIGLMSTLVLLAGLLLALSSRRHMPTAALAAVP